MRKWLLLAIATVVSLFAVSDAHAFGRRCGGRVFSSCGFSSCSTPCYTSSCYTPCYTPVVEVPVAVPVLAYPVLVPAFQFQYVPQAYAPTVPVVPVTGYPVATPIVQPVVSTGAGYASYGNYGAPPAVGGYGAVGQTPLTYQQQAMAAYGQQQQQVAAPPAQPNYGLNNKEKIRELARALLEEMNRMANDAPVDSGPPMVPGTQPQPVQQPAQPVGQGNSFFPQPQQPQPPSQDLARFAVSAMARTCAQCHTGIGSKHDMIIFTQPGLINQQTNWRKIREEIATGRMPPKDVHFQLSPQERQGILQWLSSIGVN